MIDQGHYMTTISEAMTLAVQHHQAGRLPAAEQLYRQVLAVEPIQPNALHLLGVIAWQIGKPEVAVGYISRAIKLNAMPTQFFIITSAMPSRLRATRTTPSPATGGLWN